MLHALQVLHLLQVLQSRVPRTLAASVGLLFKRTPSCTAGVRGIHCTMGAYPWYVFIIIPLALGYVIWSRRRLAGHVAANADKNVGAVAARLGLNVVEGDPNVNLLY